MLRFGFFDSEITGYDDEGMPEFDRAENSDFFSLFYGKLISDGVLGAPSDCFQVIADEGMCLKIMPGFGFIKGRFAFDDKESFIELEPAPKSFSRIDRIIFRLNYRDRCIEIVKKTGVMDATPVPPELERFSGSELGDYYELSLATVRVKSNQTVIYQESITDTRLDAVQCGIVHSLIERVSTETLFIQYEAWYKQVTQQAESDLAEWFKKFTEWYEPTKIEFEKAIALADEKAALANSSAIRLNDFISDMEAQIAAGYFNGPQGAQGIQGPKGDKGDKGERGDSGITTPVDGIFTLSGDADGNLWAYYSDGGNPPQFEHDKTTGDIYYIIPNS